MTEPMKLFTDVAPKINHLENDTIFRKHVADVLRNNHGVAKEEKIIGLKGNGIRFRADIFLQDKMIVVDTKLKNKPGTVDEKIMDKVFWMQYACDNWKFKKGIIIYGGIGWNKSVIAYLRDEILPSKFPNCSMIRYEDDVELKHV
jgi:hypothetical protein